jgi:hypothetical protein
MKLQKKKKMRLKEKNKKNRKREGWIEKKKNLKSF